MPRNLQNTRDSTRVRRHRQESLVVVREHILQEAEQTRVARGVALAELGVVQRVCLCEARLDSVLWVFGGDGCFAGAAVAGVQAEGLAEVLCFSFSTLIAIF